MYQMYMYMGGVHCYDVCMSYRYYPPERKYKMIYSSKFHVTSTPSPLLHLTYTVPLLLALGFVAYFFTR